MAPSFALYVHFPFCLRKCPYCAFTSRVADDPKEVGTVVDLLGREGELHAGQRPWRDSTVHSLFLGGGTPSLADGEDTARLISSLRGSFMLLPDAEISIEVNPGTLTEAKMSAWREAGINRVSLGVQSLDDAALRRLGRIHTSGEAEEAFFSLRGAGFVNISVDLIFGINVDRGTGAESESAIWRRTLERVIEWRPDHLSAYALTIEKGTPFHRQARNGDNPKLPEETELEQYRTTRELLRRAGYEHYEVSNWSLLGARCRHNLSYWDGSPYLALGPSGHSFDAENGRRFWNHASIAEWRRLVLGGSAGVEGGESLSPEQRFEEGIMLGLRMVEGVLESNLAVLADAAGRSWPVPAVAELIEAGMLLREGGVLRYTPEGLALADTLEARICM